MAIEFVECGSLNISYDVTGLASVSFTVVSDSDTLTNTYEEFTIGGIQYRGYITGLSAQPILGTTWWEWGFSLVMVSER